MRKRKYLSVILFFMIVIQIFLLSGCSASEEVLNNIPLWGLIVFGIVIFIIILIIISVIITVITGSEYNDGDEL